jgi:hypothetical protein
MERQTASGRSIPMQVGLMASLPASPSPHQAQGGFQSWVFQGHNGWGCSRMSSCPLTG